MDLSADMASCFDTLETVTLRRRDSTSEVQINAALRSQSKTSEAVPSGGVARQTDALWQLVLPTGESPPQLGDVVIDRLGSRWTVLEVEHLPALGRWRCATRELRLAFGCDERVDVARPVWDDLGAGPEIVQWSPIAQAVPVKIQLDELLLDTTTTPPTQQLFYDVVLSEQIALEPDDRLTSVDGASYRVQSYQQAERIDALPIARVLREEPG